jgi:hypothetical protein
MKIRLAMALVAALLALGTATHGNASGSTASALVDNASCVSAPEVGAAQAVHHAGLVVVFGEERVETLCIEFKEDEISGAELLERSGLSLVLSGFGGLGSGVCRIDDVGCSDPTDCFCQCRGAECSYWAYFALEDGAWRYLPVGASQRRLHDGDADAWVWGSGRDRPATGNVCPPVAPVPPATPTRPPPPPSNGTAASPATPAASEGGATVATPTMAAKETPQPGATATGKTTSQVRRDDGSPGANDEDGVGATDDGPSGSPTGLMAFAAVAVAVVAVIAGLVIRRRLLG